MPTLGTKSKERLKEVHPDLIKLVEEAIKHVDFTVLYGVRSKEEQEELVRTGKSKTMNSKHLKQSDGYAHAVDLAPYPIDWSNRERFVALAFFIKGLAVKMGINVRLGCDWNGDFNPKTENFFDGPHIELVK